MDRVSAIKIYYYYYYNKAKFCSSINNAAYENVEELEVAQLHKHTLHIN